MRVNSEDRRTEIVHLRLAGYTYAAIGQRFGVSRQRIQQLLVPPKPIRELVRSRAHGRCEECGLEITAGDIHHRGRKTCTVVNYQQPHYLVYLCRACHSKKHRRSQHPRDPNTLKHRAQRRRTCARRRRVRLEVLSQLVSIRRTRGVPMPRADRGRLGGHARARTLSARARSQAARLAARARWAQHRQKT